MADESLNANIPTRAEAIMLVRCPGTVLVLRASGTDEWRFVTCRPGRGDSLKSRLISTLQEETGLDISDRPLQPYNVYYDSARKMAVPARRASFSVRFVYQNYFIKTPEILPGPGIEEYRFVKPEELSEMQILRSQLPIVEDLLRYGENRIREYGPDNGE